MKRAVFTLWLLLTAVAATAQGNSPDFEFGYSDLQRLSPDDYISLQLPPLHQLLENARNTPQVEYYNKAVEIQERELKNVRRNWQHYFKLNANYNYGSSDIYNQNYQDNSNQIWTTTTTGREQSWWNVRSVVLAADRRDIQPPQQDQTAEKAYRTGRAGHGALARRAAHQGHPAIHAGRPAAFGPAERRRSHGHGRRRSTA